MVPCHGKRGANLTALAALRGSGCGVIHTLCAPLNPALESGGIFPQIMGQPCQSALFLRAKRRGKCGASVSRSAQMFRSRLLSSILSKVGKIGWLYLNVSLHENLCLSLQEYFLESSIAYPAGNWDRFLKVFRLSGPPSIWSPDRFQIRTFYIVKTDPFRAFCIVKRNQNVVVKNCDRVHKAVNQPPLFLKLCHVHGAEPANSSRHQ